MSTPAGGGGVSPIRHVILDRDGVLNQEGPGGYVRTPAQWRWLEGALDALSVLARSGILLSVATNQSCVGRGIISMEMLEAVNRKMRLEAGERGVCFTGIYCCPHAPEAGCRCRKPAPGLLERAITESGIGAGRTLFIGDSIRDLRAGRAAGTGTWLVRTGKGEEAEAALRRGAIAGLDAGSVRVVDDLPAAAACILGVSGRTQEV